MWRCAGPAFIKSFCGIGLIHGTVRVLHIGGPVGFSDLAEAPGWWLFLCIIQEHYKLITEACSAIQGAVLIMELQNETLIPLRKDLSELHCT
jgi:hypothetical protein